jgi:hypothetical protein
LPLPWSIFTTSSDGEQPDAGFTDEAQRVRDCREYRTWPAAGIHLGDRILKVNEKAFKNSKEFQAGNEPGEEHHLSREGKTVRVTIINIHWDLKKLIRVVSPYLVGLCYVLIGILVS